MIKQWNVYDSDLSDDDGHIHNQDGNTYTSKVVLYTDHAAELAKVIARLVVAVAALEAVKTPGSGPWQPIEIATEALAKLKEME